MKQKETHVVPNSQGGWDVVRPGADRPDSEHGTKKAAENRAREIAVEIGGGQVVIHGRNGKIQDADTIEPLNGGSRRRSRAPSH